MKTGEPLIGYDITEEHMALAINNKYVSKIDNLKDELAGKRKDLAKEDLKKGMTMESKKGKAGQLKGMIFEIAKDNGVTLSEIAKNKQSNYQLIENLNDLGLLDFGTGNSIHAEDGNRGDIPLDFIKFKDDIGTFKKIAILLEDKELSRFMETKYFKENLKYYYTNLCDFLNDNKLFPLPDHDYFEYALKNSPANVRFFLVDNDTTSLKSIYKKCISSTNENAKGKIKIELLEKYNMYLVWDYLIFGKIQQDLQNNLILDHVQYFDGYLPIAKKTLEKLSELYDINGNEQKDSFLKVEKLLESIKIKAHHPLQHAI
ncbi:MAG: hypothetical protein O8C66_12540 [Candidatus Methanoperedens sp.]|nr:hypothetical protein [Candidatus Methanoperedens sp.]MCZ7371327.1 hypothetical protein [Candidatus Methanoperedens sp.]